MTCQCAELLTRLCIPELHQPIQPGACNGGAVRGKEKHFNPSLVALEGMELFPRWYIPYLDDSIITPAGQDFTVSPPGYGKNNGFMTGKGMDGIVLRSVDYLEGIFTEPA